MSLGSHRQDFLPRIVPGRILLGAAIFSGVMCALEIGGAIQKYLNLPKGFAVTPNETEALIIAAILGAVFLAAASALGVLYFMHIKHRVGVFERGLMVGTWRGKTAIPWKDIIEVKKDPVYPRIGVKKARKPIGWTYTLIRSEEAPATIRGLEELERLGRVIKHETHL
ncbi:MAG: hypothetical protein WBQ23_07805 [Bacteroidota bacterium]